MCWGNPGLTRCGSCPKGAQSALLGNRDSARGFRHQVQLDRWLCAVVSIRTCVDLASFCSLTPSSIYFLGEGNGTPLQYSCVENPMDGEAWQAAVLGVAKSRTRLSIFTFTLRFHALEKEMATHSSVLAWRIPGTGEPGGLPSMGSQSRTRLKRLSSSSSIYFLVINLIWPKLY